MSDGTCWSCGCTDADCSGCIERTGEPCHWVEPDLCSACAAAHARYAETSDRLRAVCRELLTLEKATVSYESRFDVVARTVARVERWLVRAAERYNGDGGPDNAELRLHVHDFGWDDDETVMMDVTFEERATGDELTGRAEGVRHTKKTGEES